MRWAVIVLGGWMCSVVAVAPISAQEVEFVRGDLTQDHLTSLADFSYLAAYLFADGGEPACLDAADVNDDGAVDVGDLATLLEFLTVPSALLPAPFDEVGSDPTDDALGCMAGPDGEPQGSEIDHVYFSFTGAGGTGPALSPGQSPAIFDVRLDSQINLRGYTVVVEYDPTVIVAAQFSFDRGLAVEHEAEIQFTANASPGRVVAHVLVDAFPHPGPSVIAAGSFLLAAQLRLEVAPSAPIGEETVLSFGITPVGTESVTELISTDHVTVLPSSVSVEIPIVAAESLFLRGDTSGDGKVDLADAVLLLEELLAQSATSQCAHARDVDDTGAVDLADPIRLLAFLFAGGEILPPPYPYAGVDPSPNSVDCD
ncbi:MAG: hypothetical protein AAF488_07885 [Planctomycetota bacterium]